MTEKGKPLRWLRAVLAEVDDSARSANPHPVCRRGGCPLLALDGSDWCAEHDAIVDAARRRLRPGDKSDACIPWPFGRDTNGTGNVWVDGRLRKAHHIALEIVGRPSPTKGAKARLLCGESSCVNPRHRAWPGEPAVRRRGRSHAGSNERNSRAKLTDADVSEIRSRVGSGEPQKVVAADFGVSQPQVSKIVRGAQRQPVSR